MGASNNCGAAILALRLFAHRHKLPIIQKSHFYVHRQGDDGSWSPEYRLDITDNTNRGLTGLSLHTLDGQLKTEEQKLAWATVRLNDIAATFSAQKMADFIVLASQWLFDSHASRDELLSFVHAMVVLEILLGDKRASDEVGGPGALMRNRCAYLIGTSQEEREEIHTYFKKIYEVRSQIVHAGKPRLSLDERMLFDRLQWMCRRVIGKEVELLKANPKPSAPEGR